MIFNSDSPIISENNDVLGRGILARQIGTAILKFTPAENFVIGISGPWGSGKTSLLNMALAYIDTEIKAIPTQEKPVILPFNPWHFTSTEQLYSEFFKMLVKQLKKTLKGSTQKKLGELMTSYGSLLELTSFIPGVGILGKYIADAVKATGELAKNSGQSKMDDLNVIREKIVTLLRDASIRFVVIVDDIDRLPNDQICQVFQLVKSIAGFPNMIYILLYDKDIVTKALSRIHDDCDGSKYLEKIVQLGFEIPSISQFSLYRLLASRLIDIISDDICRIDSEKSQKICHEYIMPLLDDARSVYRVLNLFAFMYSIIGIEVNLIDLLLICVLQVKDEYAYHWIAMNTDEVLFDLRISDKEDYQKAIKDKLPNANEDILKIMSYLFPVFSKKLNKYFTSVGLEEAFVDRRISHPDLFPLYFSLSIDDNHIARIVMEELLFTVPSNELSIRVSNMLKNERLADAFVQYLTGSIDNIPVKRIKEFLPSIISGCHKVKGNRSWMILPVSSSHFCFRLIFIMLTRIENEEERYSIISNQASQIENDGLITIAQILNQIERAYGNWNAEYEEPKNQLLSKEHLELLEVLVLDRIRKFAMLDDFISCDSFAGIVDLWRLLDKDEPDQYLRRLLRSPVNIAKFIARHASLMYGSKNTYYSFDGDDMTKFIGEQERTMGFSICDDPYKLDLLTYEEQKRIVAFKMGSGRYSHDVTIQDAENYLRALKSKKEDE